MGKKLFVIGLLSLLISACEDESTSVKDTFDPIVKSVRLGERWNINSTDSSIVEVAVTDPQGSSDLKNIIVQVLDQSSNVIFSDSLYDNGGINGSGDIVAGDGVFRNMFLPTDISAGPGTFTFNFVVEDFDGNDAGPLQQDVLFAFNTAPSVSDLQAPDSLKSGSQAVITIKVSDPDGNTDIQNVELDLLKNGFSVLGEPFSMADDGNTQRSGDILAGDGIFSFKMDSSFAAGKTGSYGLNFVARDKSDVTSAAIEQEIYLENKKGSILTVSMPDTVTRPANIPIRVRVNEPQGLADIQRVYCELQASDGVFISDGQGGHLKINLFDDGDAGGAHGDVLAGDGIFSVILSVGTNNVADTYTFYFYMLDKVNNLSDSLTDTLVIQ
ncbi:MAG: hypothetical protein H6627_09465 [Calditrichae bacterium]|nr:hypothetical protein [Calditrichia bacterium]